MHKMSLNVKASHHYEMAFQVTLRAKYSNLNEQADTYDINARVCDGKNVRATYPKEVAEE